MTPVKLKGAEIEVLDPILLGNCASAGFQVLAAVLKQLLQCSPPIWQQEQGYIGETFRHLASTAFGNVLIMHFFAATTQ